MLVQPSSQRHSALKLANARSSGILTARCPDMAGDRGHHGAGGGARGDSAGPAGPRDTRTDRGHTSADAAAVARRCFSRYLPNPILLPVGSFFFCRLRLMMDHACSRTRARAGRCNSCKSCPGTNQRRKSRTKTRKADGWCRGGWYRARLRFGGSPPQHADAFPALLTLAFLSLPPSFQAVLLSLASSHGCGSTPSRRRQVLVMGCEGNMAGGAEG